MILIKIIKFIVSLILKKHVCIVCRYQKNLSLAFKGWPYYYLKCHNCNLVFAANQPPDNLYKVFIKRNPYSNGYLVRNSKDWQDWQNWKIETYRNLNLFDFEKGLRDVKKVLEIGPAEGKQLEIFKKRGWEVLGIEPNIFFAKQSRDLGIEIITQYIEDITFPEKVFDLAIATHVLEHLKNPAIALKKISYALKDNGRIIVEVPLTVDYPNLAHLLFFSIESLKKLLEDNNFVILKDFRYLDKIFHYDNYAVMAKKKN